MAFQAGIRQRAGRADLSHPIQSAHDIPVGIARPGRPAHPGVPALSNDLHAMFAKTDSTAAILFRRIGARIFDLEPKFSL